MKNILIAVLFFGYLSHSTTAQSYLSEVGQQSQGLSLFYSSSNGFNMTQLQYIVSTNGRLDILPTISYGGSRSTFQVFTAGVGADYYALKQRQGLPLSLALGASYNYIHASRFETSSGGHIGEVRSRAYHKIHTENIFIVPIIGYLYNVNLEDFGLNSGAFEFGTTLGLELKNGHIASLTPMLQFLQGTTQFQIGFGYTFGRSITQKEE